ncbi:DUF1214 domain-containing protein [Rhizobium sp. Root1220]|uniref:DUF1214 domain-containing protein n=1 Tax=Rhizobium sp. Root1220 TaxID=1736432 RepID=UPI0006F3D3F9|nr:DUF1214 domain-containing protein [Rhizobium sp. Root1220]KQV81740.1 hypothetical protein ASC90_05390 [Rhizobium sp. Root1220]
MLRPIFASIVVASSLMLGVPASAQARKPDEKIVTDAYLYLLDRALVIRQEHLDRNGKDFAYNVIRYNPLASADFTNPNFDVAYFEAWLAVDDSSAAVVEIPEIKGRYYTVQILDEWGEVITNINDRTFPSKPFGKYALVKPGSTVAIPEGMGRIELHSSKAKLLGRVELKGDPDTAVKLQHAFNVTTIGNPKIAPPPEMPLFSQADLIGAEIFDNLDERLASALDISPAAAEMQQQVRAVAAYSASSKEAYAEIDAILQKFIPQYRENVLVTTVPYVNHWACAASAGNYGWEYQHRTGAAYTGIWTNNPREVVYFGAVNDGQDKPLEGSNDYVIHFPADGLPGTVVDAYWSVILVDFPGYRAVQNPLKRYNFNNHSPLVKESDGSLKIAIGPKPVPGIAESNWLPAPEGKRFSLTFRTYVPKEGPRTCTWTPPAIEKLN